MFLYFWSSSSSFLFLANSVRNSLRTDELASFSFFSLINVLFNSKRPFLRKSPGGKFNDNFPNEEVEF